MATLKLYLLGSPHLSLRDEAVNIRRQKALALLFYLAIKGEPQRRDTLATLLWSEQTQQQARRALSRHLFDLKEALGDGWLDADQETIGLRTSPDLWLDVAQFRAHLAEYAAAPTAGRDALAAAVALYRDDFLNGFTLPDCPAFDEWHFFQGEALRQQFASALEQLVQLFVQQDGADAAIPYAQRRLALDPLHEPAHQMLMRLYAASGQQAAALRQYEFCVKLLADEFGAPPAAETTALVDQIRRGAIPQQKSPRAMINASAPRAVGPDVRYDWREAPTVEQIYGREHEQQLLTAWLVDERCRLVSIVGIGGLGKTALATLVVRGLAEGEPQPFARIVWRSLLNAPPLTELLPDLLQVLALPQSLVIPESLDKRLALLLDLLIQQRCLLIFDNLESLIDAGAQGGRYRIGYEDYGQLLQYVGRHAHQSSLLLTSREQPQGLAQLERSTVTVRTLPLTGLALQAGRELLHQQGLIGDAELETALIRRYSGHPLALMLVAETIAELYFGDMAAFLAEESVIFDDIRDVLDQHFARLSPLEQEIMTWLAIEREPVSAQELAENLLGPRNHSDYLEALRALQRRMLLQSFPQGIGLQNVVTEYTTNRFVTQLWRELADEQLESFNRYALLKASAKEYVRESQQRLLLDPITARLVARFGRVGLLQALRSYPNRLRAERRHGYAAGNLLNWLLALEHEVINVDLSGLTIRQAYLRGKILHDLDLCGADFKETIFTDTFDILRCITFSLDGSLLAGGTSTGHIRFWRTTDWQLIQSWKVSNDQIAFLTFSPDGQMLVSTDLLVVQLWDCSDPAAARSPHLLQSFRRESIATLFSPTARFLVTAGRQYLCFWDIASGELIRSVHAHRQPISSITFSPDGQRLATGSHDQTVRLWDLAALLATNRGDEQALQTFQGHTGSITSVAFHPNGQLLASGSLDGTIRLWDVAAASTHSAAEGFKPSAAIGQLHRLLQGHQDRVETICFSPDGRILASGSLDQTIRLWDVVSGQTIQTFHGHQGRISWLTFSPNGRILASSGHDQSVRLWDIGAASALNEVEGLKPTMARATELVSSRLIQTLQGYRRGIWSLAFGQDGQTLASAGTDGMVQIWDARQTGAQPRRVLAGHTGWVMSMAFRPDGQMLASGDTVGTIRLWDLTERRDTPMYIFKTDNGMARALCFTGDGQTLISCTSVDRGVWLWDMAHGRRLYPLTGNIHQIASLALSPDDRMLAGGSFDSLLYLWDLTTGRLRHTLQGHSGWLWAVAFSPNGQMLASGGGDGIIQLWDVTKSENQPQQSFIGDNGPIRALRFSPDGRVLASGGQDQLIRLWDSVSGEVIRTLTGHTDWVRSLCFTPDGATLLSGSDDGAIKFWDVQSGECLRTHRPDRPYERVKISGVTGLTPAQISALKELGAVDEDG